MQFFNKFFIFCFAQLFLISMPLYGNFLEAKTLLVCDSGLSSPSTGGEGRYGYGRSDWEQITELLNSATNNNIDVTLNLENLNQLLGYDALWIDQRGSDLNPEATNLSPTEKSNIIAFIATGRRVVLIGESKAWFSWNEDILSTISG